MSKEPDLAQLRFDNAIFLFDEFVFNTVKNPDAATLWGLERRFAEKLGIQPSYWSQIKSRSRQIGERLARQFEERNHKPHGWMDQARTTKHQAPAPAAPASKADSSPSTPQDDDERFIVGLVLSYYRRHPAKARQRLLDLLGEVLSTPKADTSAPMRAPTAKPKAQPSQAKSAAPAPQPPISDEQALWLRTQAGVVPIKHKK